MTAIVENHIDDLLAGTKPGDLHSTISYPVPVLVICELLGIPALAAIGREPEFAHLAAQFGLKLTDSDVRKALNWLAVNEEGSTLDYLIALHSHLRDSPPPIDYRRRRRLFPAPFDVGRNHTRHLARQADTYLTDAFEWKIRRYVWQLLTGSDPLITIGSALLHGPTAYAYRQFIAAMTPEVRDAAGEVAQRVLLKRRIAEPVAYSPVPEPDTHRWLEYGHELKYLTDIGRSDLRRTSRSLALAATAAGNCEELVHLALAGEAATARRLLLFGDFAREASISANEGPLDVPSSTPYDAIRHLSTALDSDLFDKRGRMLRLNRTGQDLLTHALPHRDRLRFIGFGQQA